MHTGLSTLGIDIGTTKVAAVIVNTSKSGTLSRDGLAVSSKAHLADIETESGFSEQNVEVLLETAGSVVRELPKRLRATVEAVGVTGQMHGVVVLGEHLQSAGPLITWQDKRCLEGSFLDVLRTRTGYAISSGFGCATLAWLIEKRQLPASARSACSIGDLLAARLCGSDRPVTDPTDAAGWGLFDLKKLNWDFKAAQSVGLSGELLPAVVPCGSKVGTVCRDMAEDLGIPAGIAVAAAIGDNQASLLATLTDPEHELALTLGTGGQLSAVMPSPANLPDVPTKSNMETKYELRPFTGGRYVVVAASLCGGSAWSWLAESVERWLADLNLNPPPRDRLYERLNELGAKAVRELAVKPHFLGERYDSSLRGSVSGIDMANFDLGQLAHGLAGGIIENLRDMLPEFAMAGRSGVVCSGNALRQNPLLQQAAGEVLGMPVRLSGLQEEAACGAALNAAPHVG